MTIGKRIKNLRSQLAISQVDFADKIGVSKQTLYKYENDIITNIPSDKIELISKITGVSPAYIMGWEESLGDIIDNQLKKTGLTLHDVARMTGVSIHWLENIRTFTPGEFGDFEIGYSWISKVGTAIGVPEDIMRKALANQEIPCEQNERKKISVEEAFGGENSFNQERINTVPIESGVSIRVLGRVCAGNGSEAIEEQIDTLEISPKMAQKGEHFGLVIKGDSMTPLLPDGDIVIVNRDADCETGDLVIALVNGSDATCKRLRRYADGLGICLEPENSAYPPMRYSNDEINSTPVKILGKVVESRRKY